MDYHQSVSECHPNLVINFSCLKNIDNVDSFNISGINGGGEVNREERRGRRHCINYLKKIVVNGQPVTVSLALGEGVACNNIFSWPFLQTIKS